MGVRLLAVVVSLLLLRIVRTIRIRTSKMWIQSGKGTRLRRQILCVLIARRDTLESSNKCFAYGEAGHIQKNCPKLKDKDIALVPSNLIAANARDTARNNLV